MPIAAAAAALMVAGLTQGSVAAAWAADGKPAPSPVPSADTKGKAGLTVEPSQRAGILGKDYKKSTDHAWTTSGDGDGFHLLVADEKDGFTWRTAATLSEPGFDTDTWIGNACVTGSGKRAVVAYAPRTFTNKADLMHHGAFTAIVDLGTGAVNKLGLQASLAHFSPGCGTGESAVLSQYAGEDKNATRLVKVDAATGATATPVELEGQVTSAVPAAGGKILAADSARVVKIDDKSGKRTPVVKTNGIPFQLKPDADGGLVYMDRPAAKAAKGLAASTAVPQGAVNRVSAGEIATADAAKNRATTLATGKLTAMDLSSTPGGTVFITGETTAAGKLPSTVKRPEVPKDSHPTVRGRGMVTETAWADGKDSRIRPEEALTARTTKIKLKSLGTGRSAQFEVPPTSSGSHAAEGRELSPALTGAKGGAKPAAKGRAAVAAGSPGQVVEAERYCSVPRNDPRKMAMQPKPRQVEWAVDQAITNNLNKHISRSEDWKNLGMGAYQPQSLFPLTPLEGGGRVPAQVMLGITAQESNMWQATRLAVPGVSANPLIGNYYGVSYASDGQQTDPWKVNWDEADCGYGITQVTDGMRIAGHEKKGEKALSPLKQEAIALDYTANIAAGVNILIEKWNKTRAAGMTVNGGDPKYIENWFFALWAYNAGFYPKEDAAKNKGVWGVGFTNNPANPLWKANRTPFLENSNGKDDYSHAKHPQDWPYQEKVLGWAGHPLEGLESPGKMVSGFRPAGWTTNADRTTVKPKESLFCTAANSCDPSKIADLDSNDEGKGACTRKDLHCFWNQPVQWKDCGRMAQCGTEILRFNDTYKEEADGDAYPPQCTVEQPSMHDTLIVDNVPNGTPSTRCGSTFSNGTFSFDFGSRGDGTYPSKIDTHQLAAGLGGHFYFSHTRLDVPGNDQWKITGTWKLNQAINGWTRVMVHMPDHGAHTRQAKYLIDTGNGKPVHRVAQQRTGENRWVDLGVFEMTGTPKVSLSTGTQDGDSTEDIAWDAVGFQKLPGKPKNFIVAMGDSYSSGEGASKSGGGDYYPETDNNGKNGNLRAACHRSKYAWSRQARLPGANASIGNDADLRDSDMDYHMIACSGARTYNITKEGQYGELPQLDQGYLDNNTTLVTISIGGNDSEFTKVFQECFKSATCETQDKDERALITDKVRPAITETLDRIAEKAPKARIVLMGYPPLLSNNAKCLNLGILSPTVGISTSESMWLNGIADHLSENMLAAAKASKGKVTFSNPKEFFTNKAICGSPETIHGIVTDLTPGDKPMKSWGPLDFGISAQSFHPKIEGARNYADSLEATLKTMR